MPDSLSSRSESGQPTRRTEYELKQRQRAQDAEDRATTWRLAAEALRESGGKLYPGSRPMGRMLGEPYEQACETLGIDPNAWHDWLKALRKYDEARAREEPDA